MRKSAIIWSFFLALMTSAHTCAAGSTSDVVGRVVAVVNDDVVTSTELRAYLYPYIRAQRPISEELIQDVLSELVNNKLLIQAARREGITVTPEEVEAEIAREASRFPTMTDYLMYLSKELNMTLQDQKKVIEAQLLRDRFIRRKISTGFYVRPSDVRQYYLDHQNEFVRPERRRVRTISVHFTTNGGRDGAMKKITEARTKLEQGEEFAALARQYSEDPRAPEGGDHGWVEKDTWGWEENGRRVLADAAFTLQVGHTSDTVETRLGFHILRVEAVLNPAPIPFEDAQGEIMMLMRRQQSDAALRRYVNDLRQNAYIAILRHTLE